MTHHCPASKERTRWTARQVVEPYATHTVYTYREKTLHVYSTYTHTKINCAQLLPACKLFGIFRGRHYRFLILTRCEDPPRQFMIETITKREGWCYCYSQVPLNKNRRRVVQTKQQALSQESEANAKKQKMQFLERPLEAGYKSEKAHVRFLT